MEKETEQVSRVIDRRIINDDQVLIPLPSPDIEKRADPSAVGTEFQAATANS